MKLSSGRTGQWDTEAARDPSSHPPADRIGAARHSPMLKATVTFTVVLSFMILMLPAHGSQPLYAQQAPAGGGRGGGGGGGQAGAAGPIQSIDARTAGMQKIDGFYPMYWDERTGSLFV